MPNFDVDPFKPLQCKTNWPLRPITLYIYIYIYTRANIFL